MNEKEAAKLFQGAEVVIRTDEGDFVGQYARDLAAKYYPPTDEMLSSKMVAPPRRQIFRVGKK